MEMVASTGITTKRYNSDYVHPGNQTYDAQMVGQGKKIKMRYTTLNEDEDRADVGRCPACKISVAWFL